MKCEYCCVTNVSALNQSLKARTESDDGIQDLDNITKVGNNIISSLAIVEYEFKNDKVTSQQCEYKSGIVQYEYKNDKVISQQYEYNKNKVTAFQLQAASKIIQAIVNYVGFISISEFLGLHVEYTHNSVTSSPINFWLHEKNTAFVRLDNFLSSEANIILNFVLGVDTLTGAGLDYILPCKTTAVFNFNYIKKIYLQHKINFVNYYW